MNTYNIIITGKYPWNLNLKETITYCKLWMTTFKEYHTPSVWRGCTVSIVCNETNEIIEEIIISPLPNYHENRQNIYGCI